MPAEWRSITGAPSTVSADGSYGANGQSPTFALAAGAGQGIRWMHARAGDRFGQTLTSLPAAGNAYQLAASVHKGDSAAAANGTFEIALENPQGQRVVVGQFDLVTTSGAWQPRTLCFTVPAGAAGLSDLSFRATSGVMRLDAVTLQSTCSCGGGGGSGSLECVPDPASTQAPAGTACDDGNHCTAETTCDGAGVCTGGLPVPPGTPAPNDATCDGADDDCNGAIDEDFVSSSDNTCNGVDEDCDGTLDEHYAPQPTSCGSGPCANTAMSSCAAGVVLSGCPGSPPVIQNDGNPCTLETCDPVLGIHPPAPSSTLCSDGSGCTQSDHCNGAGACTGTAVVVEDDGDPCTSDTCSSTGPDTYTIQHPPRSTGASCTDSVCEGESICLSQTSSPCTQLPAGAVALWPANGYTNDVVGAHDGALAGGVTFVSDFFGQAFGFGGVDGYVDLDAHAAALNLSGQATLELRMRASEDTCRTIFHLRQDDTHEQKLQVGNGCTSALSNELVTWTYVDGGTVSVVAHTTTNRSLVSGTAAHLALTFDGTTTRIYIAGVQVAATVVQGTNHGDWGSFDIPAGATLGALRTSSTPSSFFNGTMDEVALYDRALSGTEISTLANGTRKCWAPVCVQDTPPLETDDGDPCTADSCDSELGVQHTPVAQGAACETGDQCVVEATCDAFGDCVGRPADYCENIGIACLVDSDCGTDGELGVCLSEAEAGIPHGRCVIGCGSSSPCPAGAACDSLWGGDIGPVVRQPILRDGVEFQAACLPECAAHADCERPGDHCNTDRHVCSNTPCSTDGDCSAGYYCDQPSIQGWGGTYCLPAEGAETRCADNEDEDLDGAVDCSDSECAGGPDCGEICNNNAQDDADGAQDCLDTECDQPCEVCTSGQPGYVVGVDDDLDGLADCVDPDCASQADCIEAGFNCQDGVDNDVDGFIDCTDLSCAGVSPCIESPSSGRCVDSADNDGDALVDCMDPDCATATNCREDSTANCSDGLDNDLDGAADCDDPSCIGIDPCTENTDARCHDDIDNDRDGVTDCADSDCAFDPPSGRNVTTCTESGTLRCNDGLDNDEDGVSDCFDPGCTCFEQCNDGVDNDGDGQTDCADLDHCLGNVNCTEICDDGVDNNGDGNADCRDFRCNGQAVCVETDCSDGLDDEDDGDADCDDSDCSASAACPENCNNDVDDDANGLRDCADPECSYLLRCRESANCDDGVDNDRDGQADCRDSECQTGMACREDVHCLDGIDNDADGQLDCADSECGDGPPCVAEVCGNMVDDDGDGMFDCADVSCVGFTGCGDPPPPLSTIAPPLYDAAPTTLFDAMAFVYAGPTPIQYFVDRDTIVPERAAAVRGQVRTVDGSALPGVLVTVLGHTELGETRTAMDGSFTLVANGGEPLTLKYELGGFISVQRSLPVGWAEYAIADDVRMTAYDPAVTSVDMSGATTSLQVARGGVVTDADGSRQATILFPSGVGAQMVMPTGATVPLTSISVRATEFTVGPHGRC